MLFLNGDNLRINEILKTQTIVPIVNKKSEIIGMVNSEVSYAKKTMTNPVIIMAGGEGKRLMPLTTLTPKPMLPIKKNEIYISEYDIHHVFSIIYFPRTNGQIE